MIIRWLIAVCAVFAAVAHASLLDEVDTKLLSRRNVTEKTGAVCAYADFNQDRLTDILHYHKGKLYVLVQEQRDFTDETFKDTQKLVVDLGDEFAEVACSVGDINNDGLPDIVVSLKKAKSNGHWEVRYFLSKSEANSNKLDGFQEGIPREPIMAKHQVAVIDVTGDGIHDVLGMMADGKSLLCLKGESGPSALSDDCDKLFANFTGELEPLMPILFGDVDNDRYAELVFMKKETGKDLQPEIWVRHGSEWRRMEKQLPPPSNGVTFKHTLAPLLVDIDLNATMDFVVPVCRDDKCNTIENLQVTHWNSSTKQWAPWTTVSFDLGQGNTLVQEEDTLVRMKAGDANLDGYPDMLVTIGSVAGGNNYAAVIENRPLNEETLNRKFEKPSQMMIMPGLALGMIQSSSFFDFAEDGYLDVLVQWKLRDGDDWQWSLCISEPREQGDVTFLKVQTFAPLPNDKDIKDGLGVIWGGVCVTYQMETTGIGSKRQAIECQLPGNSHKAGLSPPFTLFGLGRNPNFIDVAEIGVPRADRGENGAMAYHLQKQIVPNARMMVQPPAAGSTYWVLRLYLTPSTLIFSSLIVMASTCTILLIVVLILHFREKKVDRVERQAQSHRFHFDAM